MREWFPIESAPKDGTHILAFQDRVGMAVIFWFPFVGPNYAPGDGMWSANGSSGCECDTDIDKPTHWLALPENPQ